MRALLPRVPSHARMCVPPGGPILNRSRTAAWGCALILALSGTAVTAATPAAAPGTADFPPGMSVAGKSLRLNGTGTRFKAFFRVYDAGLYTTVPVRSVEELTAVEGPKLLHLVARRDIPSGELGRMLIQGVMDANAREVVSRQLVGLAQVGEMFAARKQILSGESFGFQLVPGVGTLLLINGKPVGQAVADPGFFTMVMRLWLGPRPIDERLKAGLLSQPMPDLAASNLH